MYSIPGSWIICAEGMKNPCAMPRQTGFREKNFQPKANADHPDQRNDQSLDYAKSFLLQEQNQKNIKRGDAHTPDQRNVKQQIQRDGRADYFGQVAGGNSNLAPSRK